MCALWAKSSSHFLGGEGRPFSLWPFLTFQKSCIGVSLLTQYFVFISQKKYTLRHLVYLVAILKWKQHVAKKKKLPAETFYYKEEGCGHY